jgi:LmbE family N-acetylglucosaminyl deacetylase
MPALPSWIWSENWLLLATRPGEETRLFGGLIAEACLRGRPPLVCLLTDGSGPAPDSAEGAARAAAAERAVRRSTAALGLPEGRLFLFGLHDGTAPRAGAPLFGPLVVALDFLLWSRDCRAILGPGTAGASGDHDAAAEAAEAVAARTGLPLWPLALDEAAAPTPRGAALRAAALGAG